MTTPPTEIIIDLDRRPENGSRNPNEAIQIDAIAQFARLLETAVDQAKKSKYSRRDEPSDFINTPDRPDNVIVLNGGRGSGKTTLLYSLLSAIEQPEKSLFQTHGVTKSDLDEIKVLGVIDPSLIETKENIFVTVLTLLKKAVEKVLNDKKSDDSATWKKSLQELAGGLTRLDHIGKDKPHEEWDDALYIMEQGLAMTRSSVTFNRHFQDFLTKSLKILDKSLFIIAFDDIDTASYKGWEVLEIIRKYLAVPTILVVLSGDLDLYSTIRQQQWINFGAELWGREGNRRNAFRQQVNDLEDQYLLKVLSLKNRIDLLRLGQIMSGLSRVSVRFELTSADKKLVDKPLVEFLNEHMKNYFCVSERDIPLYRDFVLSQPVRSIIQILEALKNNPNAAFKDNPQVVSKGSRAFAALALGALTRHEISSDKLLLEDDQAVLVILRETLNNFDLWDAGYRLRPDLRLDDDNLVTLAFSSRLTAAVNLKPDLLFDYFIKVCLPHEAYRYVPNMLAKSAGVAESKIAMSQYLAFVSRNLREDSITEARQNVAVTVKYKGRSFSTSGGVVAVFGARSPGIDNIKPLLKDADDDNALAEFWKQIKAASPSAPTAATPISGITHNTWKQLHQRLAANPRAPATGLMKQFASLFASQVVMSGTTSTYLSIMNVLGALSYLMKVEAPDKTTLTSLSESEAAEEAVKEASTLVQEFGRIAGTRTHPVPNWNTQSADSSGGEEDEEDSEAGDTNEGDTMEQERFFAAFARWKYEFARSIEIRPISIYFLARVWSRFYYTIVVMDTDIKSKDKYLGWIVHRYIVAFLSAALIEEAIEHNIGTSKLNLNNPVIEDGIFLSNLGKALGADKPLSTDEKSTNTDKLVASKEDEEIKRLYRDFPFFASLLACPLWAAFLHPRVELPKKYGSGRKLWDIQISLWAKWVPMSTLTTAVTTEKLVAVGYNLPPGSSTASTTPISFDNLFDPLNSVLVQGRK